MPIVAASMLALGGCAAMYVDGNLPETQKSEFNKPASPLPVQLVFEFQTRGTANARATAALKDRVRNQVAESGLFAEVSEGPATGGALLTLTVNNIPLTDNAAAKGFIAGFTFGLAGQTVGDGYEGALRYVPRTGADPLATQQARHALWTSVGNGSPPPGAKKADSAEAGVTMMLRQLLSHLLDGLSKDPMFGKSPVAAQAPAVTAGGVQ